LAFLAMLRKTGIVRLPSRKMQMHNPTQLAS
jgi:hypothetical protein